MLDPVTAFRALAADAPHHRLAARLGVDLDALWRVHDARNSDLAGALADGHSDAGVLELAFETGAGIAARLEDELEGHAFRVVSEEPCEVTARAASPFAYLTHGTTLADLLARDCGAELVYWRLLKRG
ncbi:hypothetical protein [Phenylobacterium soli]|uniref:Uncharacterized protein n=1 Tax=Phenylobacterium soli TaxID=2170551 RepID=A0A328AH79_9CAUL|nr:hypothetical protein [Phenylobacterium soli]RAK54253.1 hypothetical protein DJ017_06805 [Phenylobacterium soli]